MTNYRALPTIKIDGKEVPQAFREDILQIFVEESLHQPGMFTLVLRNDYQVGSQNDKPWKYQDLLQIGKPITIGFSSSTSKDSTFDKEKQGEVLQGEITAIDIHFTEKTQAPIIVRGYDTSHRLHRGRYNRSFQNMTDGDIVDKIAKEVGIEIEEIDKNGVPHDYVFQENQTNMEFLRERAKRNGFELFVQDGKLNFRKPKADGKDKELTLKWLADIRSFHVRMTSAEQVKEVEVRGWDYSQKRTMISTAKTEQVLTQTQNGKGSARSTAFNGKGGANVPPKMIVVDQPFFNPKEGDRIAQAVCDEIGGQFISADAKAEGNPKIRPGKVVKLEGMGAYSGKYYITETRHAYQERVYTTEFCIRGLRGADILTTMAPQSHLQPGQTFLVGIVTDNQDPKGWGRVKVKFPTLSEEHSSNWARVVSIGAAKGRGFDCLPEIDDEVLVAFEHGDIHRPYIIGGVWNGKDTPPTPVEDSVANSKVRLRTFKTRTGSKLQFVEEAKGTSTAGIYIETAGGHKLHINDSNNTIEIKTKGGQQIVLGDTTGSVGVAANMQIEHKAPKIDQTAAATFTAQAGAAANVNAPAISLTGAATVGITSPAIALTGAATTAITSPAITLTGAATVAISAPTIALTGVLLINGKPLPF
ncbi:MAG: VgrG-related protein [Scytonematopsis contorta HA4267-MV1]|jgi:phage protein D|nr:VgrG-related protein [Scytonematopsis contorta HA4267-MV1]